VQNVKGILDIVVSMRRGVSLLVLAVLTGMPVTGVVCTWICSPTTASAHHGADEDCAKPPATREGAADAAAADGPIVRGFGHDCTSHNDSPRYVLTRAEDRSTSAANHGLAAIELGHSWVTSSTRGSASLHHQNPPGFAPPPASPLVLRI